MNLFWPAFSFICEDAPSLFSEQLIASDDWSQ